jgi:hypothetical protein
VSGRSVVINCSGSRAVSFEQLAPHRSRRSCYACQCGVILAGEQRDDTRVTIITTSRKFHRVLSFVLICATCTEWRPSFTTSPPPPDSRCVVLSLRRCIRQSIIQRGGRQIKQRGAPARRRSVESRSARPPSREAGTNFAAAIIDCTARSKQFQQALWAAESV